MIWTKWKRKDTVCIQYGGKGIHVYISCSCRTHLATDAHAWYFMNASLLTFGFCWANNYSVVTAAFGWQQFTIIQLHLRSWTCEATIMLGLCPWVLIKPSMCTIRYQSINRVAKKAQFSQNTACCIYLYCLLEPPCIPSCRQATCASKSSHSLAHTGLQPDISL